MRRPLGWALAALGTIGITVAGGWVATFGSRLLDPGKAAERVAGTPAFTFVIAEVTEPPNYVLPDVISAPSERATLLSGVGGQAAARALVERHQGAHAERLDLRIVLQGRRDNIRIVDATPRIRVVRPLLTGTALDYETAGESSTIEIATDLDRPRPIFTGGQDRRAPYFRKHSIDLKRDEQITLMVTLQARRRAYDVDIQFSYTEDGAMKTMDVPGRGRIFRVSGVPRDPRSYRERYIGGTNSAFRPADS